MPVVVCGAGPVGLVLALELAAWQVPVLLVERHRSLLSFPRGRVISTRSMEILRQLGLEREVTEIGLPRTETTHFFAGASLTAPEFGRVGAPVARGETAVSPTALVHPALRLPVPGFRGAARSRALAPSGSPPSRGVRHRRSRCGPGPTGRARGLARQLVSGITCYGPHCHSRAC